MLHKSAKSSIMYMFYYVLLYNFFFFYFMQRVTRCPLFPGHVLKNGFSWDFKIKTFSATNILALDLRHIFLGLSQTGYFAPLLLTSPLFFKK